MADYDPEVIEKAARAINAHYGLGAPIPVRHIASLVLDAVAPILRAEAWSEGLRAGADMGLGIGERIIGTTEAWPNVPANPYRKEADR